MQESIYGNLFYNAETKTANKASQIMLPYIIKKLGCKSVIDYGCGTGEWLLAAKSCEMIESILGIDGEYAKEFVKLDKDEFMGADLTSEIRLNRKFDLALSLEVAEHLPPEYAEKFICNLVHSADIVMFSAAVPCQHGTFHVNEQYPSYWRNIFAKFGYTMCDCIRPLFWEMEEIEWYYRQNMFLYCKTELRDKVLNIFGANDTYLADCINPSAWEERNKWGYLFPFDAVKQGENICIFGGGVVGQVFINQLLQTNYAGKIWWCDKNAEKFTRNTRVPCCKPENVDMKEVHKVVIAVAQKEVAEDIEKDLLTRNIDKCNIIWKDPKYSNEVF